MFNNSLNNYSFAYKHLMFIYQFRALVTPTIELQPPQGVVLTHMPMSYMVTIDNQQALKLWYITIIFHSRSVFKYFITVL